MSKKVIMIIRDGWGYRAEEELNAINNSKTPNTDSLMEKYPNVLIDASGGAVGLPDRNEGNSEVGHFTIGAGRIRRGSLVRINDTIEDGSFYDIDEFNRAIDNCINNGSSLHLIGLLQSEGVHSHVDHLIALIDLCKKKNFTDVFIHAITDGRDAPVTDSLKYIQKIVDKINQSGIGNIATISGRYFAMDRDKRWDRTKIAYDCIVKSKAKEDFEDPLAEIRQLHKEGDTDEFIVPRKHVNYPGIKDKDSIIFYNFRTDRPRQLSRAIVEKDFEGWQREPLDVFFVAMTEFYKGINAEIAFKEEKIKNTVGEVISSQKMKQLRISETEKYAHVTFFFNAQREETFPGEERIMINSPKVKTYDLKPEMSVYEIKDKLIEAIKEDKFDFIVTNLVNGDMVGHTGITEAIIKGVESVDDCLGEIVKEGLRKDYNLLVFADHGNAEDQTLEWRTSHTINPVPFILVTPENSLSIQKDKRYGLQDIAPTALDLLDIKQPNEMTGTSMIKK
ncbi:MAG: 2,3-bisphosphoglycerate-independent phosphoglycerate mutase [Nanobdellota archaeon]